MADKLLDRLAKQTGDKGMAIGLLKKRGDMKRGSTELTAKGKKREDLGPAGRAKDRAAKAVGKSPKDYAFNPKTNTARLKR